MALIMDDVRRLKSLLVDLAKEYRDSEDSNEREELAQRYLAAKMELDQLIISPCCDAPILQRHSRNSGSGICEKCREECEPKE